MFTMTELFDIAIRIEKNGKKAYCAASQKVENTKIASLLKWMGEQEAMHAASFLNLKETITNLSGPISEENLNEPLIDQLMNGETFSLADINFLTATQLHEILHIAVEFEKDTILFYEMLKSFIQEKDAKDELDAIIKEEHRHIHQLKQLLAEEDVDDDSRQE